MYACVRDVKFRHQVFRRAVNSKILFKTLRYLHILFKDLKGTVVTLGNYFFHEISLKTTLKKYDLYPHQVFFSKQGYYIRGGGGVNDFRLL